MLKDVKLFPVEYVISPSLYPLPLLCQKFWMAKVYKRKKVKHVKLFADRKSSFYPSSSPLPPVLYFSVQLLRPTVVLSSTNLPYPPPRPSTMQDTFNLLFHVWPLFTSFIFTPSIYPRFLTVLWWMKTFDNGVSSKEDGKSSDIGICIYNPRDIIPFEYPAKIRSFELRSLSILLRNSLRCYLIFFLHFLLSQIAIHILFSYQIKITFSPIFEYTNRYLVAIFLPISNPKSFM